MGGGHYVLAPGPPDGGLKTCKKSKLGQNKKYTSRTTHHDARNIKKVGYIDTGDSVGWNDYGMDGRTDDGRTTDAAMMTIPLPDFFSEG